MAKSTVDKYRVRPDKLSLPTWRAFLKNNVEDLVSIDFFIVPMIHFKLLFLLLVLAHSRRKVIHFNVTEHPTAQWTGQQIVETFPRDSTPRYLLRELTIMGVPVIDLNGGPEFPQSEAFSFQVITEDQEETATRTRSSATAARKASAAGARPNGASLGRSLRVPLSRERRIPVRRPPSACSTR